MELKAEIDGLEWIWVAPLFTYGRKIITRAPADMTQAELSLAIEQIEKILGQLKNLEE